VSRNKNAASGGTGRGAKQKSTTAQIVQLDPARRKRWRVARNGNRLAYLVRLGAPVPAHIEAEIRRAAYHAQDSGRFVGWLSHALDVLDAQP